MIVREPALGSQEFLSPGATRSVTPTCRAYSPARAASMSLAFRRVRPLRRIEFERTCSNSARIVLPSFWHRPRDRTAWFRAQGHPQAQQQNGNRDGLECGVGLHRYRGARPQSAANRCPAFQSTTKSAGRSAFMPGTGNRGGVSKTRIEHIRPLCIRPFGPFGPDNSLALVVNCKRRRSVMGYAK